MTVIYMLKWQYKTSNKNHTRAFAQDLSYQFALSLFNKFIYKSQPDNRLLGRTDGNRLHSE